MKTDNDIHDVCLGKLSRFGATQGFNLWAYSRLRIHSAESQLVIIVQTANCSRTLPTWIVVSNAVVTQLSWDGPSASNYPGNLYFVTTRSSRWWRPKLDNGRLPIKLPLATCINRDGEHVVDRLSISCVIISLRRHSIGVIQKFCSHMRPDAWLKQWLKFYQYCSFVIWCTSTTDFRVRTLITRRRSNYYK